MARKSRIVPPVRIGCAGWSIAKQHAALFGEGDSMLARYATRFAVVEINSSFYRPHQRKTYERWAASVPEAFRFSAKMPQAISHEHALRGTGPLLDAFFDQVFGLGEKLGGLLLQLPPNQTYDARVAATFFAMLRRRTQLPIACEPRHPSWFASNAEDLLRRHRVSRVAADPARFTGAGIPAADLNWPYWRWHGSPRIYYSEYSEAELRALCTAVQTHRAPDSTPWVIFDNTAHGFATPNAARLQELSCDQD